MLALTSDDGIFIDNVNLVVHEAGHLLLGWFGETLGVLGGTLFQLFVPAALATWFVFRRHLAGTAFATFLLFENFLHIAPYIADARALELPLVTVGDAEAAGHDWNTIFSWLGLLENDRTIAGIVKAISWLGMVATVAWLVWRARVSWNESGG